MAQLVETLHYKSEGAQIGECNLSILLEQYPLRFTTTNLLVREVGSSTLYACVCPSDDTTISALDSYRLTRARSMGCSARQMGGPLIIFKKISVRNINWLLLGTVLYLHNVILCLVTYLPSLL